MLHDPDSPACREAESVARGDAHDPPVVSRHLAACPACRRATAEARALARLAAAGLASLPDPHLARRVLARARAARGPVWFPAARLAAGLAGLAAVAALTWNLAHAPGGAPAPAVARRTPATMTAPIAVTPASTERRLPVEIQVGSPRADSLPFELRIEGGVEHGELDLKTHYVLDTLPERAVVVDTF